jgi:sterol 24-C-methyltransferase
MAGSTFLKALQFWIYRTATMLHSLWAIYNLPAAKVQAFMDSYTIWDFDWRNHDEMVKAMGPDYYSVVKQKLVDYYSVLNYLCAVGQVEKMYIPPAIDLNATIIDNQILFERRMAKDLGVAKGQRLLDIGCGRGRVAAHMATTTGASLLGINIDEVQLNSAKAFATSSGMEDQLRFQLGDVNSLPFPFPDEMFDGVYHVQVFSYSRDLPKLFKELYRLIKPGGRFACLDYVLKQGFDHKNPHHLDLLRKTKPLLGAIGSPSVDEYAGGLTRAGFEVLVSEDASLGGHQAPLIDQAHGWYTTVGSWIQSLVKWHLIPAHSQKLFERLSNGGDAFIEADKLNLLTTSWYIVAQKPLHPK